MKKTVAILALIFLALAGVATAANRGTPAEAKAMLDSAVAFYKANGEEKAFAAFNDSKGEFVKGDLYIFAFDMKGVVTSHGVNPKLIGKSLWEVKDADGKTFIRDFVEVVQKSGHGSVDYKWTNPESKKVEPKVSFLQKVSADTSLGCGAYK